MQKLKTALIRTGSSGRGQLEDQPFLGYVQLYDIGRTANRKAKSARGRIRRGEKTDTDTQHPRRSGG